MYPILIEMFELIPVCGEAALGKCAEGENCKSKVKKQAGAQIRASNVKAMQM